MTPLNKPQFNNLWVFILIKKKQKKKLCYYLNRVNIIFVSDAFKQRRSGIILNFDPNVVLTPKSIYIF